MLMNKKHGDDERRSNATQIGPAHSQSMGCGGRRPSAASLLLDVPESGTPASSFLAFGRLALATQFAWD
jgi:hypothetical protein